MLSTLGNGIGNVHNTNLRFVVFFFMGVGFLFFVGVVFFMGVGFFYGSEDFLLLLLLL